MSLSDGITRFQKYIGGEGPSTDHPTRAPTSQGRIPILLARKHGKCRTFILEFHFGLAGLSKPLFCKTNREITMAKASHKPLDHKFCLIKHFNVSKETSLNEHRPINILIKKIVNIILKHFNFFGYFNIFWPSCMIHLYCWMIVKVLQL